MPILKSGIQDIINNLAQSSTYGELGVDIPQLLREQNEKLANNGLCSFQNNEFNDIEENPEILDPIIDSLTSVFQFALGLHKFSNKYEKQVKKFSNKLELLPDEFIEDHLQKIHNQEFR